MAGEVEEIKRRLDLVEFIQAYVPLKRRGRSLVACCPFHREKTPSFHVFPERQGYHCFGCGRGGDIFSFLMEHESLEFREALKILAEQAGVQLGHQREDPQAARRKEEEQRLERALAVALEYFRENLRKPAGEQALAYIRRRGFREETIERFEIGAAPERWDGLIDYAERRAVSREDLAKAGVASKNDQGRFFDFFRGRVMFPVRDPAKKLVGFGGRVLDGGEPKYLNGPETPLFNKRRLLYGFHLARERLRERGHVLMMEGYTDVMMADQAGAGPAVATLGTAMSEEHLRFLKRFAVPLFLVYDSDAAGLKAAERSLGLFLKVGMEARVMTLPEGMDPCDFFLGRPEPVKEWEERRARSQEAFAFRLERATAGLRQDDVEARVRVAAELTELLKDCPDAFRREVHLEQLAARLGIAPQTVKAKAGPAREEGPPEEAPPPLPEPDAAFKRDPCYYLLAALRADPALVMEFEEKGGGLVLPDTPGAALLRRFVAANRAESQVPVPVFEEGLAPADLRLFRLAGAEELPAGVQLLRMLEEKIAELRDPRSQERGLREELRRAEKAGDTALALDLLRRLHALRAKAAAPGAAR